MTTRNRSRSSQSLYLGATPLGKDSSAVVQTAYLRLVLEMERLLGFFAIGSRDYERISKNALSQTDVRRFLIEGLMQRVD